MTRSWVEGLKGKSGISDGDHDKLVDLSYSLSAKSDDQLQEDIEKFPLSVQNELNSTKDASVMCCSTINDMYAYHTWLEMQHKDRTEVNVVQEQRRNYKVCDIVPFPT